MSKQRLPAAERREQIAATALEIIATRGAGGLTAAELARMVGVSDAALFRHFESMEAIVDAAIGRFESNLLQDFPPQHPDPLERLGAFFVQRVTMCQRAPNCLRLAFDDRLLDAANRDGKERVQRTVRLSMDFIRDCLREAQSLGRVDPRLDGEVLLWVVTGVVRGAVQQATQPGSGGASTSPGAPPEEIWRDLQRLLTGGAEPQHSAHPGA